MNNVDFDEYSDKYDQLMKDHLKFFEKEYQYFAEYKVSIISRCIKRKLKSILEYGCGIGRNLKFLKKKYPDAKLFGCDISENSLIIAEKENPDVNFFLLGKEPLENKFDLILIANVFHHISPEKRIDTLGEVVKLLEKSGNLFFFEHNPFNLVTRRAVNTCPFDEDAVLVKPKELRSMLLRFDFQITYFGYYLFIPGFLKRLRFLENYLTWLPIGGQYYISAEKI